MLKPTVHISIWCHWTVTRELARHCASRTSQKIQVVFRDGNYNVRVIAFFMMIVGQFMSLYIIISWI